MIAAHYQPEDPRHEGWLLRLSGRRLATESFRPSEGYSDTRVLWVTGQQAVALARLLAEASVAELPGNLPLAGYTDLRVTVLGQVKEIQARAFAGRTASPAEAARFERIRSELERLHALALREGNR
jgi:hypothetical protein